MSDYGVHNFKPLLFIFDSQVLPPFPLALSVYIISIIIFMNAYST